MIQRTGNCCILKRFLESGIGIGTMKYDIHSFAVRDILLTTLKTNVMYMLTESKVSAA